LFSLHSQTAPLRRTGALIRDGGAFRAGHARWISDKLGKAPEPITVEVAPVVERDVPIYSEWRYKANL